MDCKKFIEDKERKYRRLCLLMGHPEGIAKGYLCDPLTTLLYGYPAIWPHALALYLKSQYGWDAMNDNERSINDYCREKFGEEAVRIIEELT